jgi:hypothetical protein
MFNRRSFFTALGSGVAATAIIATGAAQASPLMDQLAGIEPAAAPVAAAGTADQPVEMRGRHRRRARRVVRRQRRRLRRAVRRARRGT